MIDPDDDEFGEGACDKIIGFLAGCIAIYLIITIAYLLTR